MKNSFIIFVLIGSFTFLIDYALYIVFLNLNIPLNISKTISSMTAVVVGYFLNSKYNFGKNNVSNLNGLIIYVIIYLILVAIHVVINQCLYQLLKNIHIAFIMAMGISMVVNYFAIRFYFNTRRKNVVRNCKK